VIVEVSPPAVSAMEGPVEVRRDVGVAWVGATEDAVAAVTSTVTGIAALARLVGTEQRFAAAPEVETGQDDAQRGPSSAAALEPQASEHPRQSDQNHRLPPEKRLRGIAW
jgi:hypothetical protein